MIIKKETGSLTLLEYYYKSNQIEVTETSLIKAILTAYASIFKNFTWYFDYRIIG